MTHTKGPWIVYDDWYIKTTGGKGSHAVVCAPIEPKMSDDEHRANARLIAAAPDMLGAIQGALRIADLWMPGPDCDPEEAKALCLMKKQFEEVVRKAMEKGDE